LYWRPAADDVRPLAAGSGLHSGARNLWVVADDSHHLVRFSRDAESFGEGYRIFPGDLPDDEKARKRAKPDSECLIALPTARGGERLLAFPSGSKAHRVRAADVALSETEAFLHADLVDFSSLLHFLDRRIPDLNIEGGVALGDEVLLLQRGNGKAGVNAVVTFSLDQFLSCLRGDCREDRLSPTIAEVELPKIDGVSLTFTDAALCEGQVYFSAAAERSGSTYDDGEVLGSVIGRLGREPVLFSQIDRVKVEGLSVSSFEADSVGFFAVTDADDPRIPSSLMEVRIERKAM
jgi:hypothetical protein